MQDAVHIMMTLDSDINFRLADSYLSSKMPEKLILKIYGRYSDHIRKYQKSVKHMMADSFLD